MILKLLKNKMYDYELCFIDEVNEIGLNLNKNIKVFVNIEFRWHSTPYDYNDGELSIENVEISAVYLFSKSNKLLETFKNKDQDYLPNLNKKQKRLISDWAWKKTESKKTIEELTEYFFDEAVAQAERDHDRKHER